MSRQLRLDVQSTDRSELVARIKSALSAESSRSAMASVVRLLRESSDHYDWVGIYLVQEESLVLAAYSGDEETEHVRIPIGQGICGSAAKEGTTIIVPDVSKDSRYLACFASTRSEIVVPIRGRSGVLGEIDIDSDGLSAFTKQDQESLEEVARSLALHLEQ